MSASLDFLEGKWDIFRRKMERRFNPKIQRKTFKVGDLVLKNVFIVAIIFGVNYFFKNFCLKLFQVVMLWGRNVSNYSLVEYLKVW